MKPQDAAAGEDRLCLDGCSLHAMTMLCYVYSQGSLPCCCVNFLDQNVCVTLACVTGRVCPRGMDVVSPWHSCGRLAADHIISHNIT